MHMGYLYLVYHGSKGHMLADHVDLQFQDSTTCNVTLNIPMCVCVLYSDIYYYDLQVYYTFPH